VRRPRDRGAGTVGTAIGFFVFLLLMFTAVQILFNLYATSVVTAAAHDAALDVAGFRSADDRCDATVAAEAAFMETLGAYGRAGDARLRWTCTDPDTVRVRVTASHPSILPRRVGGLLSLSQLDRTIEVRIERHR
jgi:Flp pilus assembly protein TadG